MKSTAINKTKSQLIKIFWITVAWTIISISQFLIGYNTLQNISCELTEQEPMIFFIGSILTGLIAGLIGGSGIVLLWERWLRTIKYGMALFYIFLSYALIYLIVAGTNALYFFSQKEHLSIFDPAIYQLNFAQLISLDNLYSFCFWLIVVLGTLIVLQVLDKYGPGVFGSFLLGKYFQPQREERIFMFLDLRSSTTIAETLGEKPYFNFIKEVFKDATPAILYHKGEIYQYVGDEIIVSWTMKNGLKNAHCLNCFLAIQSALIQRAVYYKHHYNGIVPEFKAGLHYGHVIAGEVGIVKRDIVFSGDVLNTTARIQSKCNELGVNILFSKYLLDRLALKPHLFTPKKMGNILLRGKQQKVMLYTL